jgi:hypothetical protein
MRSSFVTPGIRESLTGLAPKHRVCVVGSASAEVEARELEAEDTELEVAVSREVELEAVTAGDPVVDTADWLEKN